MRIVSVPGRQVRDPVTRRVVDEAGITVDPNSLFWSRMLADGDVVEADEEPEVAEPTEALPAPVAEDVAHEEPQA